MELVTKEDLRDAYPWTYDRITYSRVYTSYRKPYPSCSLCVSSVFALHNETWNIWSHVFGTGLMTYLTIYTFLTVPHVSDRAILCIYTLSSIFTFASSSAYHTFCCHSDMFCRKVQCMDWFGIILCIASSNLMASYYEIREFPILFWGFNVGNVILGIGTYQSIRSSLEKVFLEGSRKGEKKTRLHPVLQIAISITKSYSFRTIVGILYGLGVLLAWGIGKYYRNDANKRGYGLLSTYGCMSTVGLCLLDIPERFYPRGALDIVGYSHQWFHWGIVMALWSLWNTYYMYAMQL